MKKIKKLIIVIAIILVVFILALITIPYLFKDQITKLAKQEINNSINGEVNFSGIDISLIKSFPNLEVEINDLQVIGNAPFDKDTLAAIKSISAVVNIWKAIKGEYEINEVAIDDANIHVITNSKGLANYDLAKVDSSSLAESEQMQNQAKPSASNPSSNPTNGASSSTGVAQSNSEASSSEASSEASSEEENFKVQLKSFRIQNMNLSYIDSTSQMYAEIKGFNLNLSGDFSADETQLNLKSSIESLLFGMEGINYLSNASVQFNTKIDADLKQSKYTLADNQFLINQFELGMNGWVQSLDSSLLMDLKFAAKESSFQSLLDLVPEVYKESLQGVTTKGSLGFNGFAKGELKGESYPQFGLSTNIKDGYVQYPDLPAAITAINVAMNISHPEATSLDATVVSIDNFSFKAADNQFKSNWLFQTPISDLAIDGKLDADIDLKKLATAMPLGDMKMAGLIKAQIAMKGKMSQIEKQQYEQFKTSGFLSLSKFSLQMPSISKPILIDVASMNFTSQAISLDRMDMNIGKSDFHLSGKISNYIAYALRDGLLKGNFKYSSKRLDANELMALTNSPSETAPSASSSSNESKTSSTSSTSGTSSSTPSNASTSNASSTSTSSNKNTSASSTATTSSASSNETDSGIQIPSNIDFVLSSKIDQIIYEQMIITNTTGDILVRDSKAHLENLNLNLLDGSVLMNGLYDAKNTQAHKATMNIKATSLSIPKTAMALPTVGKLAPIMKKIQGSMSANMDFNAQFDAKQEIVMNSINSKGNISTSSITIDKLAVLDELANKAGMKSLSSLNAKPLNVKYTVNNGVVKIDTFKCNVNNYNATVWGTHGLDQQINYYMRIPVPASTLGGSAAQLLGALGSDTKEFPVVVNFKGDIQKPSIALDMSEALKMMQSQVKTKTQDKVKDVLGGFLDKLK